MWVKTRLYAAARIRGLRLRRRLLHLFLKDLNSLLRWLRRKERSSNGRPNVDVGGIHPVRVGVARHRPGRFPSQVARSDDPRSPGLERRLDHIGAALQSGRILLAWA